MVMYPQKIHGIFKLLKEMKNINCGVRNKPVHIEKRTFFYCLDSLERTCSGIEIEEVFLNVTYERNAAIRRQSCGQWKVPRQLWCNYKYLN